MSAQQSVSVVIATRDRLNHVRRAIRSVLDQTVPCEVMVMDDGSPPEMAEALRVEFPQVRVETVGAPVGSVRRRNVGIRLATGAYVVQIDDDVELGSTTTIEETLRAFDHPRIGAVTIPFINARTDARVHQRSAPGVEQAGGTFVGCSVVFRRSAFEQVGGYDELLVDRGEEADLTLRLYAGGYVLRLGRSEPALHWEASLGHPRAQFYSARSEVLVTYLRVPRARLLDRSTTALGRTLVDGVQYRGLVPALRGTAAGLRTLRELRGRRFPVPLWAYTLTRNLRRKGPMPLDAALAIVQAEGPDVPGPQPA